jgi:DNA-directed RNA polymerase specialized sigma24 family protein
MQSLEAAADADQLLTGVLPVVRAILRRKSGMSLVEDDPRRDNVDAIELYHDALTRLWGRIAQSDHGVGVIGDLKGDAAAITYNVWSDYLRARYPKRTGLKNRLRYFLGHQPKYAVWKSADGELVCGLHAWSVAGTGLRSRDIGELFDGSDRLPRKILPPQSLERCTAEHWDRYLDALFSRVGAPVELDELISVTARMMALHEAAVDSLGGADEDDAARHLERSESLSPQRRNELRSSLRQLWIAVCRLKTDYRFAYLLNIPRGDIEVFAVHGIATIAEIGSRLALSDSQYQLVWEQLKLQAGDADAVARAPRSEDKFYVLWRQLPLADTIIAKLLGVEVQQVISRRMLAMRELARHMHMGVQLRK